MEYTEVSNSIKYNIIFATTSKIVGILKRFLFIIVLLTLF